MRTAVILLVLLALASIPGSVLPQRGVASDPGGVQRFNADHPLVAPVLDRLGFFNVFSSPWFAAIYLLLLISMTGCVIPRSVKLWRACRAQPPAVPRHLERSTRFVSWEARASTERVLEVARVELSRRRFRVVVDHDAVRAEKGFMQEVGNLVFHLSLLVLLLGIATGKLFGYEGRVVVPEGGNFANVRSQYDEFSPAPLTDVAGLAPFQLKLEDFAATFERSGADRGSPRSFKAEVSYQDRPGAGSRRKVVSPNNPLVIGSTKVFLTGHGYAPLVTVRDGNGVVAFRGPVVFIPIDSTYASDGVIKVPDAQPQQIGFEGVFLPTADMGPNGLYSLFPDALDPRLVLTAWVGDLGMGTAPQSVYELDKSNMEQLRAGNGPFAVALKVGERTVLPGGRGSITFDGVSRFANLQIARDPGKEISLLAAVLLLTGLTLCLVIRRRRIWVLVRAPAGNRGVRVLMGARAMTKRGLPGNEFDDLAAAIRLRTDEALAKPAGLGQLADESDPVTSTSTTRS